MMHSAEIVTTGFEYDKLAQNLLANQLTERYAVFANGASSNNHLGMGFDEVDSRYHPLIASGLSRLVTEFCPKPHYIASVPTGADGWGELVTKRLSGYFGGPMHLKFKKVQRREFANTPETPSLFKQLFAENKPPVGVVLDDATTDGGTSEAMANFLSGQGLEVGLVLSIFYRGDLRALKSRYRRGYLIAREIPTRLDWEAFREIGEIKELQTEIA